MQIDLSWTQYTAGTGTPILEDTTSKLSYLDTVWYPDLRAFLAETNTTIEVDDPCIVPVQRTNDKHIMDFVLRLNTFTKGELRRINYCKLYLDVHTISDIATAYVDDISRRGYCWVIHRLKPVDQKEME